jgi:hypothetical protein
MNAERTKAVEKVPRPAVAANSVNDLLAIR